MLKNHRKIKENMKKCSKIMLLKPIREYVGVE